VSSGVCVCVCVHAMLICKCIMSLWSTNSPRRVQCVFVCLWCASTHSYTHTCRHTNFWIIVQHFIFMHALRSRISCSSHFLYDGVDLNATVYCNSVLCRCNSVLCRCNSVLCLRAAYLTTFYSHTTWQAYPEYIIYYNDKVPVEAPQACVVQ
jgi:hypothetical protein